MYVCARKRAFDAVPCVLICVRCMYMPPCRTCMCDGICVCMLDVFACVRYDDDDADDESDDDDDDVV